MRSDHIRCKPFIRVSTSKDNVCVVLKGVTCEFQKKKGVTCIFHFSIIDTIVLVIWYLHDFFDAFSSLGICTTTSDVYAGKWLQVDIIVLLHRT